VAVAGIIVVGFLLVTVFNNMQATPTFEAIVIETETQISAMKPTIPVDTNTPVLPSPTLQLTDIPKGTKIEYQVQEGDTVQSITLKFNCTVEDHITNEVGSRFSSGEAGHPGCRRRRPSPPCTYY
jgi:hypothetical protein